jgi:hypothetical protein
VAASDAARVTQTAPTGEFAVHQFKNFVGTADSCALECGVRTNIAPSAATVFLQIFNRSTVAWVTVDSDNASSPGSDFILQADVANLTDYKDASSVISCRVYQQGWYGDETLPRIDRDAPDLADPERRLDGRVSVVEISCRSYKSILRAHDQKHHFRHIDAGRHHRRTVDLSPPWRRADAHRRADRADRDAAVWDRYWE